MISEVKGYVDAMSGRSPLADGLQTVGMNPQGGFYVMDWIDQLINAGLVHAMDLGTAGTPLTGNAAVDADQPEFTCAVDSGWLVPIAVVISAIGDADAYNDIMEVLIVGDRTNGEATLTATAATTLNMLDGGDAFGGTVYHTITGNMTITEADILYAAKKQIVQLATETTLGGWDPCLNVDHVFPGKPRLKGPCQIAGYVCGGAATSWYGRFVFAHLPSNYIRTV